MFGVFPPVYETGMSYRAAAEISLVPALPQLNLAGSDPLIWSDLGPLQTLPALLRYPLSPPPTGAALPSKFQNSTPQHFFGHLTRNTAVMEGQADEPGGQGHRDVTSAFPCQHRLWELARIHGWQEEPFQPKEWQFCTLAEKKSNSFSFCSLDFALPSLLLMMNSIQQINI